MNSGYCNPACAIADSTVSTFKDSAMPTRIGVPTAPKVTGVLWMINVHMTAASAGKPRARSKGPATAAGVPKPDAPSIKAPNIHATMMS